MVHDLQIMYTLDFLTRLWCYIDYYFYVVVCFVISFFFVFFFFFFQAEDGIRDVAVTGVQTCALPIFVPVGDNYYAALNSAVFSDGSFVFIPKGVRCPMELSTYFRINTQESGQF